MSIRAETNIKFSTYYKDQPSISDIRDFHDRISLAIMDICEELDIKRSHISVRCPVGYEFATFYGTEGEEAYDLDEGDELA